MPAYELFLIVRNLERPELVKSIKRGAELILKRNGVIREFQNLGYKSLPYRIKAKGSNHTHGNYILIKFDVPTKETITIDQEIRKDNDFLRSAITLLKEYADDEFKTECPCKEQGEFVKYPFDFRNPMTSWDKKRVYKDYGVRL